MLDENLNHYHMFHFPDGGGPTGDQRGHPRACLDGRGAAVYIGRATGDTTLVTKALRMGETVADMIYDNSGPSTGATPSAPPNPGSSTMWT